MRQGVIKFMKENDSFGFGIRNLKGIEIGVWKGKHAFDILSNVKVDEMYLIDPYLSYDDYKDPMNQKLAEHPDEIKAGAINKLAPFNHVIRWIFDTSDNALESISKVVQPMHFDFIYIDGNHAYEYAKKDILNYLPYARYVIAGDDYYNDPTNNCRVKDAVNEIFPKHLIQTSGRDWWVFIPDYQKYLEEIKAK